jgi:hypothetical protein
MCDRSVAGAGGRRLRRVLVDYDDDPQGAHHGHHADHRHHREEAGEAASQGQAAPRDQHDRDDELDAGADDHAVEPDDDALGASADHALGASADHALRAPADDHALGASDDVDPLKRGRERLHPTGRRRRLGPRQQRGLDRRRRLHLAEDG